VLFRLPHADESLEKREGKMWTEAGNGSFRDWTTVYKQAC